MGAAQSIFGGWQWLPPTDQGLNVWMATAMYSIALPTILNDDGTINRKRLNWVIKSVPANSEALNGTRRLDFTIDAQTGVWCRVYVPTPTPADSGKRLPIIVYYHGGGFALFSPDVELFDVFCSHISETCQAIVVSSSYRLAPEHKHPIQYEDSFAALEWLRSQSTQPSKDFPVDVTDFSHVFLMGDSAGGNIAHNVAVRAGSTDISPVSIAGLMLVQPFFGGEERTGSEIRYKLGPLVSLKGLDWYWRAFLPPGSDRDHPSANVCGPKSPALASLNLPRTLVVAGGKDPLQDRNIQYAEALKSAGKECKLVFYENAFHGFYSFPNLQSFHLLLDEIKEFVRQS